MMKNITNKTTRYIYVDFENINNFNESVCINNAFCIFFINQHQKIDKIVKFVNKNHCELIPMYSAGKNCMDFYIIHYLTLNLINDSNAEHYILSKDKGFDSIIKHINEQNYEHKVTRINDINLLKQISAKWR